MNRCGILFNAKQNNFFPYLDWIVEQEKQQKNFSISGVFSNNPDYIIKNHTNIKILDSANEVLEKSDVVFSLGYWRVLKKEQISKVPMGIVNFHHSYKLKYRGRHCATWVIRNEDHVHGSTMHYINEVLDEGEIIETRSFPIAFVDTAEDLFIKSNNVGFDILKDNFQSVINGEANRTKNHEQHYLYYKSSDLKHEIDFNKDTFLRDIRSLTFDGKKSPYLQINGAKIYLKLESHDDGILRKQNDI